MANFFSDNLAAAVSAIYDPTYKRAAMVGHARMRKKRIALTSLPATAANDTIVLTTMRSSDRIYDMRLQVAAGAGAGTVNTSIYRSASDHVPVAANLLRAGAMTGVLSVVGGINRGDIFVGGTAGNIHRGLPLWQIVNISSTVFTRDPGIDMDLVFLTATGVTTPPTPWLIEIDYASE
jgi:hypothetical protein